MIKDTKIKHLLKIVAVITACVGCGILFSEIALAAGDFNIDKVAKAGTDPLIKALKDYWTTVLVIIAGAALLLGQGDLKQRAQFTAVGVTLAAAVMVGILAVVE